MLMSDRYIPTVCNAYNATSELCQDKHPRGYQDSPLDLGWQQGDNPRGHMIQIGGWGNTEGKQYTGRAPCTAPYKTFFA